MQTTLKVSHICPTGKMVMGSPSRQLALQQKTVPDEIIRLWVRNNVERQEWIWIRKVKCVVCICTNSKLTAILEMTCYISHCKAYCSKAAMFVACQSLSSICCNLCTECTMIKDLNTEAHYVSNYLSNLVSLSKKDESEGNLNTTKGSALT